MQAKDFMTKDIFSLGPDKTVLDAAKLMLEQNISVVPVTDFDSNLLGVITDSDFVGENADVPHALADLKKVFGHILYDDGLEDIYKEVRSVPLEEIMCQDPKTVTPSSSLNEVVNLLYKYNLRRVLVVEEEKVVGIITRHDILKAFAHLS